MLSVFDFQSQSVRVLIINNEPWFVAKDVFAVFDISWTGSQKLESIKDSWKMTHDISDSPGRPQSKECADGKFRQQLYVTPLGQTKLTELWQENQIEGAE